MKKIIVEIFFIENNFSAHVPELPGCISTGRTNDEIISNIQKAIEFHLEGIKEDGDKPPVSFSGKYELVYKFL